MPHGIECSALQPHFSRASVVRAVLLGLQPDSSIKITENTQARLSHNLNSLNGGYIGHYNRGLLQGLLREILGV